MNSGFYSAFTGYATRIDALDILANNLANTNTNGFKVQHLFYRAFSDWMEPEGQSPMSLAANQYGVLGGNKLDLSQGNLSQTGNDTDVALQGPGFFAVSTKNGVRYTRNGNFALDANRNLVTQNGDLVLSGAAGSSGQAIQIPVSAKKITINADGSLSVDGALVAKLQIDDFAEGTQLTALGNGTFAAPEGSGVTPVNTAVTQGAIEGSNADAITITAELMDLERTAQTLEKAIAIFHNEFNRTAAQEIGRV
jgi:flagellar basal-body rod protein FlgF